MAGCEYERRVGVPWQKVSRRYFSTLILKAPWASPPPLCCCVPWLFVKCRSLYHPSLALVAGGWWPPPWLMSAKTRPCLQSSPSTALANLVYTLPNSHYLDIKWGRRVESEIRTLLVLDLTWTWHIQQRHRGLDLDSTLHCIVNETWIS